MCIRISNESKTTIKGNVEPLVSIRGPRVAQLQPAHEMSAPFARRRPQSERTIDVYPRAILLRDRDQRFKLVIRTRVDITRLQKDDRRRAGRFRQLRRERSRDQFAVLV